MALHHPPVPDPFAGTPYRALCQLGSGGMGEVFLVEDGEGRRFAGKILHRCLSDDPRTVERMRIEAETTARLKHPNVTQLLAFDRTPEGYPYIVLERLHGRTLREELFLRGPLPVAEALVLTGQLLSALGAAHALGIVHRDIKPDNLFVCAGSPGVLKVLDFGIARVASSSSPVRPLPEELLTITGEVVGTPLFQSPEGAQGRHVDARADLYTAGLILYILLAGRGPFDHHEGQLVLAAHAVEEPKPPSHHAPQSIPEALDRVVLRALRKDPDERFQTAEAFQRALLDAGASASARRDTPAARRAAKQAGEALRGTASALAVGAIFLLTGAASAAAVAALYGAP